jgi:hypothetical protein
MALLKGFKGNSNQLSLKKIQNTFHAVSPKNRKSCYKITEKGEYPSLHLPLNLYGHVNGLF